MYILTRRQQWLTDQCQGRCNVDDTSTKKHLHDHQKNVMPPTHIHPPTHTTPPHPPTQWVGLSYLLSHLWKVYFLAFLSFSPIKNEIFFYSCKKIERVLFLNLVSLCPKPGTAS